MESKRESGDTPTRRVCLCEDPHGSVMGAAGIHDLGTLPGYKEQRSAFGYKRNSLSPGQCMRCSQISNCDNEIMRIEVRTISVSTILSRFGPVRFFLISKFLKMVIWKEIYLDPAVTNVLNDYFSGLDKNYYQIWRIWNISVEKKTLSTALGYKLRSFDCRSTTLTTELHRRPTSSSPQADLLILPSGYWVNEESRKLWTKYIKLNEDYINKIISATSSS